MAYTRKTSDIITSYDLDCVLEQIKDNSEVARLLLKQRHPIENLVDNHINYISISNSDKTRISYLTPERLDALLSNGEDVWTSSKRFHIKPGAFISKIFKNIHPKEVENFSQLFRNVQTKITTNFKIVSGSNIPHYYHYQSYLSESGSLGNSCMKYDSCQDYLDLYTDNTDKISMLVMTTDDRRLIGRALLWSIDDMKIMDRIYTIDDETYQFHFKKWADDNGYLYKKEQKWNNTLFFESKGKTIYKEISFELKSFKFNHYPYMDTFKFLDTSDGVISNIPRTSNVRTLSSADGSTYEYDHLVMCEKSKLFYNYNDTTYLNYCQMRVHDGICVYSDVFDTSILREDAEYDPTINDWIFKDDDLNNHVVLKKTREMRNNQNTRLDFSALMGNMVNEYLLAADNQGEPPQEQEHSPF
jgi:hypothetical protein